MLVKFVLLLFCFALINAKSLVQKDPRLEGRGEIKHAKLPGSFKDLIRGEREDNEEEWNGDNKVGANLQVEDNADGEVVAAAEEEKMGENAEERDVVEEEEDEEEEEEDEEEEKNNSTENKKDDKSEVSDEDEEEEVVVDEEEVEAEHKKDKDDEKDEEEEEEEEEDDDDDDDVDDHVPNLHSSKVLVGASLKHMETFKFPKQPLDSSSSAVQTSESDNNFVKTLSNLFNVESFVKNFLPPKDSSPKENLKETKLDSEPDDLLIAQFEQYQSASQDPALINKQNSEPMINLDDHSLASFVSQAIPTSLDDFHAKLQGLKDSIIPKDFNDFQTKLQGFKNLWQKNINGQIQQMIQEEPKVGFGGWAKKENLIFGNITNYVNKAVEKTQAKLDEYGHTIYSNNPPLTIYTIPYTPITFKLKYVEGAHTLDKYGQSKAIRYNKLYAFTQYKFTELRYYYDVIIKPYNLYTISRSITVILNDAQTKMNLAIEKDNKMSILGLEFVNPDVMLDCNTHRFINYGVNYLVNDVHPVIKQKVVEIVSRDSKLMLTNYLKDAQ